MKKIITWIDNTIYPDFTKNWDDILFRNKIIEQINETDINKDSVKVLDYGAGRGNVPQMNFKGEVGFVAGVDPVVGVKSNPYLDEGKILSLQNNTIDYPNDYFDIVFSDNVMEHIHSPDVTLKEISRVLKRGGVFLAKTPSRFHYVAIIASCTPHWFHRLYNKLRGRDENDTFPTLYNMNTKKAVSFYAQKNGFRVMTIDHVEGRPEYLRINAVMYLFGVVYEKIVNSFSFLEKFRCVLIFKLKKI